MANNVSRNPHATTFFKVKNDEAFLRRVRCTSSSNRGEDYSEMFVKSSTVALIAVRSDRIVADVVAFEENPTCFNAVLVMILANDQILIRDEMEGIPAHVEMVVTRLLT